MKFSIINLLNKKNISLFIFLFVSFLFSIKYLSRVTPYFAAISFTIIFLYLLMWKKKDVLLKNKSISKKITLLFLFIFALFSFFLFKKIPVETLNVDRWSVITSFWNSYFNDNYVYFAKSNVGNYPGPMPFYFILALPFYFIGELGWFSIFGVLLFYLLIEKNIANRTLKSMAVVLILINIPYLWEIVCRSNVFLNATLVLWVIIYFINQKKINSKNSVIIGVLIGLVLSTRTVFVIPFIIAFVYALKNKRITIQQTLLLGTISLITVCLTFLPFIWNHIAEFKVMNPFLIQSTFLIPFKFTLLFILLSFIAGFYCKTETEIYFYSGVILFSSILIYFIYWIIQIGFRETFINSFADISYFILCLPFALYHVIKENDTPIKNMGTSGDFN
jgi:hypothetical protein